MQMIPAPEQNKLFAQFLDPFLGKPQENPIFHVIAGGVGAGKTSFRTEKCKDGTLPHDIYLHEPDLVMQATDSYQHDLLQHKDPARAFATWEMPARLLAETMLDIALEDRLHILYERTCGLTESYDFLKTVKDSGYRLHMHILHTDLPSALARAQQRETEDNRHTPPEVITARHKMLKNLWHDYKDLSDEIGLYNNTDNTARFQLIFEKNATGETIHAAEDYSTFCATVKKMQVA